MISQCSRLAILVGCTGGFALVHPMCQNANTVDPATAECHLRDMFLSRHSFPLTRNQISLDFYSNNVYYIYARRRATPTSGTELISRAPMVCVSVFLH